MARAPLRGQTLAVVADNCPCETVGVMTWSRSFAACTLLLGLHAHAEDPEDGPEPSYDLKGEIAWARATWPDEMKGLRFKTPVAKLFRWVTPGRSIVAYVHTGEDACKRVEVSYYVDDETGESSEPPILNGKLNFKGEVENGKKLRAFDLLWIGERLEKSDDWQNEVQDEHGRWRPNSSGGYGLEGTMYGVLSYVDDRIALFGGDPVEIHEYCLGPFDWLPCASGGERPCDRCEQMSVTLTGEHATFGYRHVPHDGRPITCDERCPTYPESPLLRRLQELRGHVRAWRPSAIPRAAIPSLYRFREDCLREHPPRPARADGRQRQ